MLFNLSNECQSLLTIIMVPDFRVGVEAPLLYAMKVGGKKVLLQPNWSSSNFNLSLSYCAIAFLMYSSGFVLSRWHPVPFFSLTSTKLKKSKLCWRWTKKLTKCEATKGEGKRLYTLLLGYSCWLYLVMNENGRRAKKWKWHCTWEEAETGERDHLLAHCQG